MPNFDTKNQNKVHASICKKCISPKLAAALANVTQEQLKTFAESLNQKNARSPSYWDAGTAPNGKYLVKYPKLLGGPCLYEDYKEAGKDDTLIWKLLKAACKADMADTLVSSNLRRAVRDSKDRHDKLAREIYGVAEFAGEVPDGIQEGPAVIIRKQLSGMCEMHFFGLEEYLSYASLDDATRDAETVLKAFAKMVGVAYDPYLIHVFKGSTMRVTSCQVFPLTEVTGKTQGFARVSLNNEFQLNSLRIVEGVNGLFVAYPNDPSYKGDDYRSLFYPQSRELRDHIEQMVLTKFRESVDGK